MCLVIIFLFSHDLVWSNCALVLWLCRVCLCWGTEPQDSSTIRPSQIMRKQKDNYLTHCKELTKKQSKLECYLTLNREYTVAEYLTTVTDPKLRKALTMYRLSEHSLAIEKGHRRQTLTICISLQHRMYT